MTTNYRTSPVARGAGAIGIALLLSLIVSPPLTAGAPAPVEELQKVAARPGDRCLVCNVEVGEDGFAFLYRGRRIVLDAAHLQVFLDDPLTYFSRLQPRGALFHENVARPPGPGWLVLGLWVLLGLVVAALNTHLALRRGLPPVRWFFAGLALNLAGVLLALRHPAGGRVELPPGLAKIPSTAPPVACPKCGAGNHPSAAACAGCGSSLRPATESEVARSQLPS